MKVPAIALAAALFCGAVAAQAPTGGPPAMSEADQATIETALKSDDAWWSALSPEERTRIGGLVARQTMMTAFSRNAPQDPARTGRAADLLAKYHPQARERSVIEDRYLRGLERSDPAAAKARVSKLLADPNREVAQLAETKTFVASLASEPLKFHMVDIDGKTFDMEDYRGKVVLFDFWATWCKPCMAEMPHLRAVYDKYKDQGFQIIGITDDTMVPELIPGTTRQTMESFRAVMAKANMNWPQLWEHKPEGYMGVRHILRKFDVTGLPTTLLFGKDGRLITKDNRGEKLEQNVRKALGLPAEAA